MKPEIDVQEILKNFREIVGTQAQEIAVLKAVNAALKEQLTDPIDQNPATGE
jgi:hypothetical protein